MLILAVIILVLQVVELLILLRGYRFAREDAEPEAKVKDSIDEGFENIMTFSVRGSTGFKEETE